MWRYSSTTLNKRSWTYFLWSYCLQRSSMFYNLFREMWRIILASKKEKKKNLAHFCLFKSPLLRWFYFGSVSSYDTLRDTVIFMHWNVIKYIYSAPFFHLYMMYFFSTFTILWEEETIFVEDLWQKNFLLSSFSWFADCLLGWYVSFLVFFGSDRSGERDV